MKSHGASVYVNKLAVAERLTCAAIRMFLVEEDDLAIYVTVSSAYSILKDLRKRRQGRSDAVDPIRKGLFSVASDLATGRTTKLDSIFEDSQYKELVLEIAESIKSGKCSTYLDIPLQLGTSEDTFWRKFNEPFNFLKHADRDDNALLNIDLVNTEHLILRALELFSEFVIRETPEADAMGIYWAHSRGAIRRLDVWSSEVDHEFFQLDNKQRKRKLLSWVELYRATQPVRDGTNRVSLPSLIDAYFLRERKLP